MRKGTGLRVAHVPAFFADRNITLCNAAKPVLLFELRFKRCCGWMVRELRARWLQDHGIEFSTAQIQNKCTALCARSKHRSAGARPVPGAWERTLVPRVAVCCYASLNTVEFATRHFNTCQMLSRSECAVGLVGLRTSTASLRG